MTEKISALVVGAGPVGLAMAAELARYRVPVRIIDKAASPSDKSKALVIWSRTLELFDRMGCADDFAAAGLRLRGATLAAEGRRLAHFDLSGLDSPHPYALAIPQSETERLFALHLAGLGGRVERETELLDFSQSPTSVRVRLKRPDGGEEALECDWLLGCDGAHSTVRHVLGVPFSGVTEPADFLLADVRLVGEGFASDELGLFWHRDGILGIFPLRLAARASSPISGRSRARRPAPTRRSPRCSASSMRAAPRACASPIPSGSPISASTSAWSPITGWGASSSPATPRTSTARPAARG